jgi:hypothetical protein
MYNPIEVNTGYNLDLMIGSVYTSASNTLVGRQPFLKH